MSRAAMGGVTERACEDCLSRAWLVASLSGHIETAVSDKPGRRARELLALDDVALAKVLAPSDHREIQARAANRDLKGMHEAIEAVGAWTVCRHRGAYPAALREGGAEAPAVLFALGERSRLSQLTSEAAVTVVGSRRPSGYGRELAAGLARECASAGLVVVSGMALGIDSCAHRGALDAGGLTVAVLGSGPDVPHPARMRKLYEEIVERGLVLSELPPGTSPRRWTFPARNRIMAALGAMTVVVEARERSGSLITAGMASDLGREVGAVPGRVGGSSAAGANSLLRDGAQVIRDGQDVLDSLLGAGAVDPERVAEPRRGPALDPVLAPVLSMLEPGVNNVDAVAASLGLTTGEAAAALTRLELAGYVNRDSAGRYERTPLAAPDP